MGEIAKGMSGSSMKRWGRGNREWGSAAMIHTILESGQGRSKAIPGS